MVPPPPMLASEHHYYELLGVPYDASDDDLKKAYRKLCVQNHCLRKPPHVPPLLASLSPSPLPFRCIHEEFLLPIQTSSPYHPTI